MQIQANTMLTRVPWNKGKITGAKPPLLPKHVWSKVPPASPRRSRRSRSERGKNFRHGQSSAIRRSQKGLRRNPI
jgi:hypothetical protein